MLYIYGIVDSHDFETIPGEGHEERDVVAVPFGPLAAAVSTLPALGIQATAQSVWRHQLVLGRLMRDHAVLPLRFGTTCRDADGLRESLLDSVDGFVSDLTRVGGKVELALRIVDDSASDAISTIKRQIGETVPNMPVVSNDGAPTGRGAAHLRARRLALCGEMAREDRANRMAWLLREYFNDVLSDVACVAPADISAAFLVSCLVEFDRVTAFGEALDRFRQDHPHFAVTCTGPWAPYSFVAAMPNSMRAA